MTIVRYLFSVALAIIFLTKSYAQEDTLVPRTLPIIQKPISPLSIGRGRLQLEMGLGISYNQVNTGIEASQKNSGKTEEVKLGAGGGYKIGVAFGYTTAGNVDFSLSTGGYINWGRPEINNGIIRWTSFYLDPVLAYRIKCGPEFRLNIGAGMHSILASTMRIDASKIAGLANYKFKYGPAFGWLLRTELEGVISDNGLAYAKLSLQLNFAEAKFSSGTAGTAPFTLTQSGKEMFGTVDVGGVWFNFGVGSYF